MFQIHVYIHLFLPKDKEQDRGDILENMHKLMEKRSRMYPQKEKGRLRVSWPQSPKLRLPQRHPIEL